MTKYIQEAKTQTNKNIWDQPDESIKSGPQIGEEAYGTEREGTRICP